MGDVTVTLTTDDMREDANKRFMSLEKAIWLAVDILPKNNIDIASKRLAMEVFLLQMELGKTPTKGDWRK